ncbi:MAG: late competence development ComFB family protein [Oscillospiraceae bacterium]|nr:late competence development ComFB family protein [Oscillospiraceae bacterium]
MASKDKTSKTARVMNLLSKKPDPALAEAEEAANIPAAPAAPVPPIVTSMAPDAAVSVQIKNALEDALEGELGAQQPAAPAPVQPDPDPAPVQAAPEPAPGPEPEPIPVQPEPVQAAPEPEAEAPAPEPVHEFLEPENPGYINVMQVLVEEKAPKYVEMFGLCTCKRCMEDVKAYTLNHLPPKYVVLEPNDRVPRLTVYEGKFSSDITAQLLQACKVVMGTPHHSRT